MRACSILRLCFRHSLSAKVSHEHMTLLTLVHGSYELFTYYHDYLVVLLSFVAAHTMRQTTAMTTADNSTIPATVLALVRPRRGSSGSSTFSDPMMDAHFTLPVK